MTYKDGFIGVVKVGGKIMRELNGEVRLPFGSEFSLLLKNKESRKAVVSVEIDGKDVLSGQKLVINANQEMELEGFLSGNSAKNRFKFIQKTKEIQDFRGDRIDDGMIRIGVRHELPVVDRTIVHENHIYHDVYPRPYCYCYPTGTITNKGGTIVFSNASCSVGGQAISSSLTSTASCNMAQVNDAPSTNEGITVKGSEINQAFTSVYTKQLEEQEKVIILILKGYTDSGVEIKEPITVQTKRECSTCGRVYGSSLRFCGNCGTCLVC